MEPACCCSAEAAPLPVAWLRGDTLAEYVRFLDEAAASACVAVAWLEGEASDEFLQFLEESRRAAHGSGGDLVGAAVDGVVVDGDCESGCADDSPMDEDEEGEGGGFVDDDDNVDGGAGAMDEDEEGEGDGFVDEDDDDVVLAQLLPHVLDLPAFRARAAAPAAQQEPTPPPEALHPGGWLQRGTWLLDCGSSSCSDDDDEMASEDDEETDQGGSLRQETPVHRPLRILVDRSSGHCSLII